MKDPTLHSFLLAKILQDIGANTADLRPEGLYDE